MADASNSTRLCKACANSLPETEFYSSVTRHGSIWTDGKCKGCRSSQCKQARDRALVDPAEAERRKLWRMEHKRKLRRKNGQRLRSEISASAIARREAEAKARAERKARPKDHDAHVKRWRGVIRAREAYRAHSQCPEFREKQARRRRDKLRANAHLRKKASEYNKQCSSLRKGAS